MDPLIGRVLGPYELVARLGSGGMGAVYRAVHRSLRQPRAVKVLAPHLAAEHGFVERFRREARLAAALRHPNIVQIYDVGEQDDLHYIVMELLEGQTLRQVIESEGPLPLDRAARLLAQLAAALDYAHARNVVHRDVKPGNVFVGAGDHVTLLDFGIARDMGEARLSRSGLIGTPEYMAPEVIDAGLAGPGRDMHSAGLSGDLYSLGVVAYEMLTGQLPFQGAIAPQVLFAQVHKEPLPPRRHRPDLPAEAERVILRQLSKQPSRRYSSAGEFSARFADSLQPTSLFEKVQSAIGRGDAVRAGDPVNQLLAQGVKDMPLPPAGELARRYQRWRKGLAKASKGLATALPEEWGGFKSDKLGAWVELGLADAAAGLQWELELLMDERAAGGAWPASVERVRPFVREPRGSESSTAPSRFQFSPDGATLASTVRGAVRLWRLSDGSLLHSLEGLYGDWCLDVAFSADGQVLAVSHGDVGDCEVRVLRAPAGTPLQALRIGYQHVRALSPDGRMLATTETLRGIRLWRVSDGAMLRFTEGEDPVFSPDGRMLATSERQSGIRLWRVSDGAELHRLDGFNATFSPDRMTLATTDSYSLKAREGGEVRLWRLRDGFCVRTLRVAGPLADRLVFAPSGQVLATSLFGGKIELWRLSDGALMGSLDAPAFAFILQFSPDGQTLALVADEAYFSLNTKEKVWGNDVEVLLWNLPRGTCVRVLDRAIVRGILGHYRYTSRATVSFLPDGQHLAIATFDALIGVWLVWLWPIYDPNPSLKLLGIISGV